MPISFRKLLIVLIGVLVLGLYVLVHGFRAPDTLQGFRWDSLTGSLRGARASLLILSLLTIYVCYVIRAVRWMRLSRNLGPSTFWKVYRATLMGFTSIFIFGRAGEPVRPILIARQGNLPIAGMFGVYLIERIIDLVATVVLTGTALLMLSTEGGNQVERRTRLQVAHATGVFLLIGLAVAAGLLVYFRFRGSAALEKALVRAQEHGGWRAQVSVLVAQFGQGLQGIQTISDLGTISFYTALHWFLVGVVYLWVPWSFGGQLRDLTFSGAMLVLGFTAIGSTLQLPGVGGGAQVASFFVFTTVFGVQKEPAAAAAVMLWLITFAGPCLIGLPLLLRQGWHIGTLGGITPAEAESSKAF